MFHSYQLEPCSTSVHTSWISESVPIEHALKCTRPTNQRMSGAHHFHPTMDDATLLSGAGAVVKAKPPGTGDIVAEAGSGGGEEGPQPSTIPWAGYELTNGVQTLLDQNKCGRIPIVASPVSDCRVQPYSAHTASVKNINPWTAPCACSYAQAAAQRDQCQS